MILDRLLVQECQITRRKQTGAPDKYQTPTWQGDPTAAYCHVQPISSEELAQRPASRVTHRGWFKAETLLGPNDRVVLVSGQGWEVDGKPRIWWNPRTGRAGYLEVDLAEVE